MRRALAAAGLAVILAHAPAQSADLTKIDNYRSHHEAAIVGQLDELVRLKSVAADPQGLAETARHLQQLLKERGFETSLLTAGRGVAPVVLGSYKSAGAKRTVMFYAHYDGQPVTPSQAQPNKPTASLR